MENVDQLFSGFAPVSKETWKAKAVEDLKGADFDKKLVWKTYEGFPVYPYYTGEDTQSDEIMAAQDRLCARTPRVWTRYAAIRVTDAATANQQALELVRQGATGVLFTFAEAEDPQFPLLLKGLDPLELSISFATPRPSVAFLSEYLTFLFDSGIKAQHIKGFYASDVLESWITTGEEPNFESLANLVQLAADAPEFKTLVVQSHAFVNAGANTTQELAFTLNKVTDFLDRITALGVDKETVMGSLMLHMAIGGDYFFEISKLRAVRILLKSVLDLYGTEACSVPILSSNALWSKSFYDPNINLLRNTTEAMSAVVGGCDALLVQPHDAAFATPASFSQRVALNISTLLKEESYFDKVVDPAAGCYYIEWLTATEADRALTLFKEIELLGGFIEAFRAGLLQEKIRLVRDKKESDIASRKRVYVGTNKYPNAQEQAVLPPNELKEGTPAEYPLLVPQRATRLFEELRSRTGAHQQATGQVPRVYLYTFGNLAMRKARAAFSSEFFTTAGFTILGEFFHDQPLKAAEESAASGADIVVICSSDADYEDEAIEFAQAFKALAKDKLLVVAGYPEFLVEPLKSVGVDSFIHVKSNAIKVLTEFQNKLFAAAPGHVNA